jgi:hypothetical protein
MTSEVALQKIPKGILHTKEEDKHNQESMRKNKYQQMSRLAEQISNEYIRKEANIINNKMTGNATSLPILTLNVNGLSSLIKRHRMVGWITKTILNHLLYTRNTSH